MCMFALIGKPTAIRNMEIQYGNVVVARPSIYVRSYILYVQELCCNYTCFTPVFKGHIFRFYKYKILHLAKFYTMDHSEKFVFDVCLMRWCINVGRWLSVTGPFCRKLGSVWLLQLPYIVQKQSLLVDCWQLSRLLGDKLTACLGFTSQNGQTEAGINCVKLGKNQEELPFLALFKTVEPTTVKHKEPNCQRRGLLL